MRVLLIEDNAADAALLGELAQELDAQAPFALERVATLAEGLARLEDGARGRVDLVLTDLGLPDATDLDAVTRLRACDPDLPIVVLTGSPESDRALAVLRAGADDYLVKGRHDADALARSLRYAVERRRTAGEAREAIREEARVVEALHRIGELLVTEKELATIVQIVTDEATVLTGAAFGAFFYNQVDEAGESYMLHTLSGVDKAAFAGFPMPRATHVFRPTFEGIEVVRVADITADPRYGQNPPYNGMPKGHLPVRSYLAAPVNSRYGGVLGGLFFGHPEAGVFQERHERLAVGIASWAATAMDNARLYDAEHKARMAAEEANRVKSDFMATMSHELRTPLNAMLGYTDLWRMGIPDALSPAMLEQVGRVRLSARHLLALIEEILTFARLEAASETVELEDVALGDLVEAVAAVIEPLALGKGLEFRLRGQTPSATLRTDSRKARQILINLLSNAVKFTPDGHVGLAVRVEGDNVVFETSDSGVGIDPENLERIFEPFWQARQSTAGRPAGTGLGLTVSRRLALLLGGELSVRSSPGEGTTFTVALPLRAPTPA